MPIWKLEPLDTSDPNWRASIHSGDVVIRAGNEDRAREIAMLVFGRAVKRFEGQNTLFVPWDSDGHVRCTQLTEHGYAEDGAEEILDPARFDRQFRR